MLTSAIIIIIVGILANPPGEESTFSPAETIKTTRAVNEEISILDHFPLVDGIKWKYDSNLGEVTSWVTASGDLYTVTSISSPVDSRQTLRLSPEGLLMIEAEVDTWLYSNRRIYLPPLLRFPLSVKVGQEWSWEGKELVDDDTIHSFVNGKIIGWESVTVPAGTYRCLKVYVSTISDDGTFSSSTQWLAPGIGIVKADITVDAGGFSGFIIGILGFDTYNLKLTGFVKSNYLPIAGSLPQ